MKTINITKDFDRLINKWRDKIVDTNASTDLSTIRHNAAWVQAIEDLEKLKEKYYNGAKEDKTFVL